ncbi:uncharacterized protein LOC125562988 [Nematostella vectensis]|uniref:uncharacterized protein LOC125562988 n=1 Tax=Nematostella vectensis TaxID=45351 RepID=UPI00207714B5|nr:uncharacterized protein LOC125562988 [Nematostella vectensis]
MSKLNPLGGLKRSNENDERLSATSKKAEVVKEFTGAKTWVMLNYEKSKKSFAQLNDIIDHYTEENKENIAPARKLVVKRAVDEVFGVKCVKRMINYVREQGYPGLRKKQLLDEGQAAEFVNEWEHLNSNAEEIMSPPGVY